MLGPFSVKTFSLARACTKKLVTRVSSFVLERELLLTKTGYSRTFLEYDHLFVSGDLEGCRGLGFLAHYL